MSKPAFHTSPVAALTHPSTWLGLAGIAGTTAPQLPEPHKTHCFIAAGVLSVVGTILKTPTDTPVGGEDAEQK